MWVCVCMLRVLRQKRKPEWDTRGDGGSEFEKHQITNHTKDKNGRVTHKEGRFSYIILFFFLTIKISWGCVSNFYRHHTEHTAALKHSRLFLGHDHHHKCRRQDANMCQSQGRESMRFYWYHHRYQFCLSSRFFIDSLIVSCSISMLIKEGPDRFSVSTT